MSTPLLSSSVIRLRSLEPDDLMLMYKLENDTRFWEASGIVQPLSRAAISAFIQSGNGDIYSDHQLRLTIDLARNCQGGGAPSMSWIPIGFADLVDFSPRHSRAEVGIGILPQYHSYGYASESLKLLEQYASEVLCIHQLYAYVVSNNIPAISLFTKMGYSIAGELTDWLKSKGKFIPVIFFQKLI